jgi:hypothetical protein
MTTISFPIILQCGMDLCLPIELAPTNAMLDEIHKPLAHPTADNVCGDEVRVSVPKI